MPLISARHWEVAAELVWRLLKQLLQQLWALQIQEGASSSFGALPLLFWRHHQLADSADD